jgi:hypothetical protein
MSTFERYIVRAGNDPRTAGFEAFPTMNADTVRLRTDLTGSSGGSQGDPDGDILDAEEDITLRYNDDNNTLELIAGTNGPVQTVATNISGLTLQYLDRNGTVTAVGANVSMVRVTLTGASTVNDPHTKKPFAYTLTSDIKLASRG